MDTPRATVRNIGAGILCLAFDKDGGLFKPRFLIGTSISCDHREPVYSFHPAFIGIHDEILIRMIGFN